MTCHVPLPKAQWGSNTPITQTRPCNILQYFTAVNISKNIHRFIFILSVQGIIGKLDRPGKSASGYSVILRCHLRVSP